MVIQLDNSASLIYESRSFDQLSLESLLNELPVRQEQIRIFGKTMDMPRLTAYQGEKAYTYSNITNEPTPYSPQIKILKEKVCELANFDFNSVLINYYRDGQDSMGCHRDNEPELDHSIIASLSFGASRKMRFKHIQNKKQSFVLSLRHGSLLIMKNAQVDWLHEIPKTKKVQAPRLNLTFRKVR